MKEIWKPIAEAPLYAVSTLGRVRRLVLHRNSRRADGILNPSVNSRGYARVTIHGRAWPVHRFVADAFIGPLPLTFETNHIDGVKTNNRLTNLEYLPSGENQKHAARLGLRSRGSAHYCAKLTEAQVRAIRRAHRAGQNGVLARKYGVNRGLIQRVVSRRTWKHI